MKLNHTVRFTGNDEPDVWREGKHWWWYSCNDCGANFRSTFPPDKQRGHEANWKPRDEEV